MEPKSFSATAMQVAELCMARYKAEYIDRGRGFSNPAAQLGTSVHAALEDWVRGAHLDKSHPPEQDLLLDLFRLHYMTVFGSADTDTVEYTDGIEMLKRWFDRNRHYFEGVEVVSLETKENFPIKTSLGEIPYNYIFDRLDYLGDDEYKVVDYKTQRMNERPETLRKKIQVRAYGLATQIKYPNAKRIWVELDMLRHDGPVGIALTRDDNIAAWKYFKEKAQQIIDTADPKETLNPECRFCVRKTTCKALASNEAAHGAMSLGSASDLVDIRANFQYRKAGIEAAIKELDELILAEARNTETTEWESATHTMRVSIPSRRSVDSERVQRILTPEIFAKYGSHSITMTAIDKLLKGSEITDEQKAAIRGLIYKKSGQPSISVEGRSAFSDS